MPKLKEKVVIIGSTGMLGHIVFEHLNKQGAFTLYDIVYRNKLREESIICDIKDILKFENLIDTIKPDHIINCVGILIKGSNENRANAIFINAYFPHYLVAIADKYNAKVTHISTDCVFSGNKGSYSESDFRDADDIYGRSKALGEINDEKHLTIRTSIVGPELKVNGEGLFHWFLNQTGEINGYKKSLWGGVTTLVCANAILQSIYQNITGILNLTNAQGISKYEMLVLFKKTLMRDNLIINATNGKKANKSLISERNDFQFKVPPYKDMFEEMALYLLNNKDLYAHYNI